jgi:segregation and condensation protein B
MPRPLGPLCRRRVDALPLNTALPPVYRMSIGGLGRTSTSDPLTRSPQLALIEAALLISDEPMPLRRLAQAVGAADVQSVRKLVQELEELYEKDGTAFQVEEVAGGFQLLSRSIYHRWLTSLRRGQQEMRLTAAARETLAIVAYRQPITRADIEAIRGVNSAEVLRLLMEKGLLRIAGRDDSLGRPVLYGTTKKFMQVFGLRSLKDLPRKEQIVPSPTGHEAN